MSGPLESCPQCGEPLHENSFGDLWCFTCERYLSSGEQSWDWEEWYEEEATEDED